MQSDTFAIIPDRESIETVDRDIRFFRSITDQPAVLTAQQIKSWNRDRQLWPGAELPEN